MTVWVYAIENGEFVEMATVEDGEVVDGDSGFVEMAFPGGIPEDEVEVARMFMSPPSFATTDFDMEFEHPQPEGVELSDGEVLQDFEVDSLPEWDRQLLTMHQQAFEADGNTRVLSFSPSELPTFVKARLKEAVRGGAVFSQFDTLPSDQITQLRLFLEEELTESGGWTIDGLANRLQDLDADLSFEDAERIARTETASVVNSAREIGYEEKDQIEGETFYWSGSLDNRTTQACEWLINKTNPFHGGDPVPMDRLKELIEEAPEHDDDMDDDLARPENFVVHPQERKTWVRHIE